jgi:hypothetical protein
MKLNMMISPVNECSTSKAMKKRIEKKYTGMALIAGCLLCMLSQTASAADCRKTITDKIVGIEKSKLRLEFSRDSGALVRILNIQTDGEYFKASSVNGMPCMNRPRRKRSE